jgi:hypothetical protein
MTIPPVEKHPITFIERGGTASKFARSSRMVVVCQSWLCEKYF